MVEKKGWENRKRTKRQNITKKIEKRKRKNTKKKDEKSKKNFFK